MKGQPVGFRPQSFVGQKENLHFSALTNRRWLGFVGILDPARPKQRLDVLMTFNGLTASVRGPAWTWCTAPHAAGVSKDEAEEVLAEVFCLTGLLRVLWMRMEWSQLSKNQKKIESNSKCVTCVTQKHPCFLVISLSEVSPFKCLFVAKVS